MDEDGLQSGQEFVAGFICGDKSRFLIQILDLKLLDGHLQGLQERGFGCLQEFSFGSFALGSGPGSRGAMYQVRSAQIRLFKVGSFHNRWLHLNPLELFV